jgi:hypothetical protein
MYLLRLHGIYICIYKHIDINEQYNNTSMNEKCVKLGQWITYTRERVRERERERGREKGGALATFTRTVTCL